MALLLNSTPIITDPPGAYDYAYLIGIGLLFILALGQLHIAILVHKGKQSNFLIHLGVFLKYALIILIIILSLLMIIHTPNLNLDG